MTTCNVSGVGRDWIDGGRTSRVAWWHRLFSIYCLNRQDMRFILYLNHPVKLGYTMKMDLCDLDAWAAQLVSDLVRCPCVHFLS